MEYRIVLSDSEAFELCKKLKFVSSHYVKDEYTGTKRIRTNADQVEEKEYETPVTGLIHRITNLCSLGDITDVWFEYKWVNRFSRFEIEFEGAIPEEFKDRENIRGWNILQQQLIKNI